MPSRNLFDLTGRIALVTGGAGGIGRGIVEALADWGAEVLLADLADRATPELAEEIRSGGRRSVESVAIDVTRDVAIERVFSGLDQQGRTVHLLVNAAGVLSTRAVVDLSEEEWTRIMTVNTTSVFLMSRAAVRRMIEARLEGSIVSIASIGGKVGDPLLSHYSASKFGVVGFTQALAREVGKHGITVNAVCPGVVRSQMIDTLVEGWGQSLDEMVSAQAIPRPQTPREIAEVVAFLDGNRAITGQAINVDGGTVFH